MADRAVNQTDVQADGTELVTNVCNWDDAYLVDCAVTGSDIGMPDDPKFPLVDLFRQCIFKTDL